MPDPNLTNGDIPSKNNSGAGGAPNPNQTLFVKGKGDSRAIDPNDPIQDQLGDCGLIASMKAVAVSNPDIIQNAITANKDGTYNVRLYMNGAGNPATTVKVSPDNLPLTNGAAFNGDILNGKQEIWPNIIEKAIIQAQGGAFQNQSVMKFQEMLTGKPSVYQDVSQLSNQQIADTLKSSLDAGNPTVVWTHPKPNSTKVSTGEIIADHAYTVTSVDTKNMTVNLRNPWGTKDLIGLPISDLKQHFTGIAVDQVHQQKLQASVSQGQFTMPADSTAPLPDAINASQVQPLREWNLAQIDTSDPSLAPVRQAVMFSRDVLQDRGTTMPDGSKVAKLENYTVTQDPQNGITLYEAISPNSEQLALVNYNPNQSKLTLQNEISSNSLEVFTAVNEAYEQDRQQEQIMQDQSQTALDGR
jgi:hypothetical protein